MTGIPSFFPFEPNKIFEGVVESKIINLGYLLKNSKESSKLDTLIDI